MLPNRLQSLPRNVQPQEIGKMCLCGCVCFCWAKMRFFAFAMLSLVSICFLVTLTLVPLSRYVHSKMFVTEKAVWSKSWNQTQPSPASPMGPQLSQACTPFTRCAFKMTTCKIDHLHQKREQCKSQVSHCCLLTVIVASPFAADSCSWLAPLSTMVVSSGRIYF